MLGGALDGPANAGGSTAARHISSPQFDARHAFRTLNHEGRILVSRLRSMRTVEIKSAVVHVHIVNRDSRFLCSRHSLEAARVGDRQTPATNPCGLIVLTMRAPTEIDDKK